MPDSRKPSDGKLQQPIEEGGPGPTPTTEDTAGNGAPAQVSAEVRAARRRIVQRRRALNEDMSRIQEALAELREHVAEIDLASSDGSPMESASDAIGGAPEPTALDAEDAPLSANLDQRNAIDALFGRLQSVEQALAAMQTGSAPVDQRIEARLDESEKTLKFALKQGLWVGGVEAKDRLERRVTSMSKSVNKKLILFGVGFLLISAAVWWQTTRRMSLNEQRIDGLVTRIEQAVEVKTPDMDAVLAPLKEELEWLRQRTDQIAQALDELRQSNSMGARPAPSSSETIAQEALTPEIRQDAPSLAAALERPEEPSDGQATEASSSDPKPVPNDATHSESADLALVEPEAGQSEPATPALEQMNAAKLPVVAYAKSAADDASNKATRDPDSTELPTAPTAQDPITKRMPFVLDKPRWMVQIIGFRYLSSAQEFAAANKIADSAWTLRAIYQQRPWYSVLIGDYADYTQASRAAETLSRTIPGVDPIARQLKPGLRLAPTAQ